MRLSVQTSPLQATRSSLSLVLHGAEDSRSWREKGSPSPFLHHFHLHTHLLNSFKSLSLYHSMFTFFVCTDHRQVKETSRLTRFFSMSFLVSLNIATFCVESWLSSVILTFILTVHPIPSHQKLLKFRQPLTSSRLSKNRPTYTSIFWTGFYTEKMNVFSAHVPLSIMSVLIIFLYSAIWTLRNLDSNPLSVSAGTSVPFVDLTSKQTSPLLSLPCLNLPPRSWTSSWVVFWTGALRPLDAKCLPAGRLPGTPTFVENCMQPNVGDVEQRGGGWSPVLPQTNRFTRQRNGWSQKLCLKLSRNICPQRSVKVTAVNNCTMSATNFWVEPKLHPFLLSILPTSYLMYSLSTFWIKWSKSVMTLISKHLCHLFMVIRTLPLSLMHFNQFLKNMFEM